MSKRHHYIPRYYLKGFTNSSDKIWVYPIDGNMPFQTGIGNVGVERYFYSKFDVNSERDIDSVERHLAENIEQPANAVLKKIRQGDEISSREKYSLAVYMVGMLTRVPRNRERVTVIIPHLVEEARKISDETLRELASDSPEDQKKLKKLLKKKDEALGRIETELIKERSLPFFDHEIVEAIFSLKWMCFNSKKTYTFVTSDNPFCYNEMTGFVNDKSIFIFPISSDKILLGRKMLSIKQDTLYYGTMPASGIQSVNEVIVGSATKFVCFGKKTKWVSGLINRFFQKGQNKKHESAS